MSQLLIPDSGPLFSLAAGNLLGLLARFRVGISDIVREETIDRGFGTNPSIEAQRLLSYYTQNAAHISIFKTQVGMQIRAARALDPNYQTPRNLGELSIQSLLIDLQLNTRGTHPVILFEDAWFLKNATSLAKPYTLLSTQAFLEYAEQNHWIKSANQARQSIAKVRPGAYPASEVIQQKPSSP
jgi:hypothetical protein